jgi:hypothetical protein
MESTDKLILVNGSSKSKLKEVICKNESQRENYLNKNSDLNIGSFFLSYRYDWNEALWVNNIHNDRYARSLGYDRGLVEAPGVIDQILYNKVMSPFFKPGYSFSWKYNYPLYHGIEVTLYLSKDEKSLKVVETKMNFIIMIVSIEKS